MADAKICDRCGEYYAPAEDAPALYVTDQPYVPVTVTEDELNRLSGAAATVSTQPRSTTKNASVEVKDLCEDCQQALEDFWDSGGDSDE